MLVQQLVCMLGRLFIVSPAASMNVNDSLLKHSHAPACELKLACNHGRKLHHASRHRSTCAHVSMTVIETNRHKHAHERDSPLPSMPKRRIRLNLSTCMICMTVAASLTFEAKQVRQSKEAHAGTTPVVLTLPTVAFSPTHPLKPAGMRPALACHLASVKWQLDLL